MTSKTKSDLLRKTADEFDDLMLKFDQTKSNLVSALSNAQLKDEAIAEHVRAFDEGKRLIAELLPIRDNVEAMKSAIVMPVAQVIADSADTNKRFGWAGILFGAAGILFSFLLPYFQSEEPSRQQEQMSVALGEIRTLLQPAAAVRLSSSWRLVLYDRFEGVEGPPYEGMGLLQVGDVGRRLGYESIGFEPREELRYQPVEVYCQKGCRLSFEAMVRVVENVDISQKQVADGKFSPVPPIRVEFVPATGGDWKALEPLQSAIKVEWIGSKNRWQSVKTPYVDIPAALSVGKVRISLQPYRWERGDSSGQAPVQCMTDFDEVKLFESGV